MTDEQTPDPHAALFAEVHPNRRVEAMLKMAENWADKHSEEAVSVLAGGIIRMLVEQITKDAAALVLEKARADAAEKEVVHLLVVGEPQRRSNRRWNALQHDHDAEKARADRLAAIVREAIEARTGGRFDAYAALAQAEEEGLR